MAIFLLLLFHLISSIGQQLSQRLMIAVIFTNLISSVFDCIFACVDGRTDPMMVNINIFVNSVYFISTGVAAFFWLLYCLSVIGRPLLTREPLFWLASIPMDFLTILTLVSLKSGVLFYIDAAGVYNRGPLYPLQVFVCLFYLLLSSFVSLRAARKSPDVIERPRLYTQAAYALLPMAGGLLQALIFGLPALCIAISFGFLTVYMQSQEEQISIDALTRLNNRHEFTRQLYFRTAHYTGETSLELVILDVNAFKSVNDKYGHVEGDAALIYVADALRRIFGERNAFIARYGGDEFVVLCSGIPYDFLEELCRSINPQLDVLTEAAGAPYHLSVSFGLASYSPDMGSPQDLLRMADAELYKAKYTFHSHL